VLVHVVNEVHAVDKTDILHSYVKVEYVVLCVLTSLKLLLLPAALRAAQICLYLVYSEADFEVFRPAGATRCTDGGEIWHGGWDRRSPPPCQISPRQGCRTPKIEIFTQI